VDLEEINDSPFQNTLWGAFTLTFFFAFQTLVVMISRR
jgi:hypothetical protein